MVTKENVMCFLDYIGIASYFCCDYNLEDTMSKKGVEKSINVTSDTMFNS